MRLLLDTHVLLWWLANDPALPRAVREAIAQPSNETWVSAASIWEAAVKRNLGRLRFHDDDLKSALPESGFRPLPVTIDHALLAGSLPNHHRDPFDRMLVAQARLEGLTLVTRDPALHLYDAPILWA